MQHPLIRQFDIGAWLQGETKARHLVGREVGRQCRGVIAEQLRMTARGAVTTLDGAGVDHLDFTGADECFVTLISRVQVMEYGDMFLVLAGLTPTPEENLAVALERKMLATLVQRKEGPEIVGDLHPYLREAFAYVKAKTICTARDLADEAGISISLASTKLLSLHKARLVQRRSERMPDGGRQFVYSVVEGSVSADEDMSLRPRRVKG